MLKILEERGLKDNKFFGGDTIGLVDICYGWIPHWFEATEEVVGVRVVEPSTLPRLYAWALRFKEISVIRENLPAYEDLVAHLKHLRPSLLSKAPTT